MTATVPAAVDVDPDTVNLKRKGGKVIAYVELPVDCDLELVDAASIRLVVGTTELCAQEGSFRVGDYDANGIADMRVTFGRAELCSAIKTLGAIPFTVCGAIDDGFTGLTFLRISTSARWSSLAN